MADIRIKDLATTASTTASDDFLAVDGTTNGTRKLSAATPSFATSVTVPGVVGPTSTDLTLTGGTSGASLVLGQGASGVATINGNALNLGGLNVTGTGANVGVRINNTSTGGKDWYWLSGNTASGRGGMLQAYENGGSLFPFAITGAGNVLVGTTTDAASLAGGLVVNGSGAGAAASSTTTGALRVTGGVGVSGAGYFGGTVSAPTLTDGYITMSAAQINRAASFVELQYGKTAGGEGVKIFGNTANVITFSEARMLLSSSPAATAVGTGGLQSPNFGLSTIAGGASYFGGVITAGSSGNISIGDAPFAASSSNFVNYSGDSNGGVIASSNVYLDTTILKTAKTHGSLSGSAIYMPGNGVTGLGEIQFFANTVGPVTAGAAYAGTKAMAISVSKVNVPLTTSASSSTVGALTIGNGSAATNVAIGGGNVWAGAAIVADSYISAGSHFNAPAGGDFRLGATYARVAKGDGVGGFVGGYNVTFNSGVKHDSTGAIAATYYATSTGINWYSATSQVAGTAATPAMTLAMTGVLSVASTTPSTGVGSGALQVAGGIYAGAASVFAGQVTGTANASTGVSTIAAHAASNPRISLKKGNATANQGLWDIEASTDGVLLFRAVNDADSAASNWMSVTRTGATATSVNVLAAATFSGAVSIGNTVAVAAAVASTHKVTMVIGGVTYYLLATNV